MTSSRKADILYHTIFQLPFDETRTRPLRYIPILHSYIVFIILATGQIPQTGCKDMDKNTNPHYGRLCVVNKNKYATIREYQPSAYTLLNIHTPHIQPVKHALHPESEVRALYFELQAS